LDLIANAKGDRLPICDQLLADAVDAGMHNPRIEDILQLGEKFSFHQLKLVNI
jgi:hypothetical protein